MSDELDFAPLDEGVHEFSQAAEDFAGLWAEATNSRRVMPRQGVDQGMVRRALLRLLKAARRLEDAIKQMPPKVREHLEQVPPPPGGVWVYSPPEPLPKRAQEAIAFAERWFSKLEHLDFWEKADREYDFFRSVTDLMQTVWDGLPETRQRYERLKDQIEADSLLDRANRWLGSDGIQEADVGPAPASGEQADTKQPEAGTGESPKPEATKTPTEAAQTAGGGAASDPPAEKTRRKRGPTPLTDQQASVYRDIAQAWNQWSSAQKRPTHADFAEAYRDEFAERYQEAFRKRQWGWRVVVRALAYLRSRSRREK